MKPKTILTAGPSITDKEVNYVLDAIKNGWNSNWDHYIQRFEKSFADYVGTKYARSPRQAARERCTCRCSASASAPAMR